MKLAFSGLIAALFLLYANIAMAAGITATHQITAQQQVGSGLDLTVTFHVTNTTAQALAPAALKMVDPMLPTTAGGDVFYFDALAAGESVTIEWLIHLSVPMVAPGAPIQLEVSGVDAAGQTVIMPATSLEEVLQ